MPEILTLTFSAPDVLENVRTTSSPIETELEPVWDCDCSEVETLFADPPNAVALIFTVRVAVPVVQTVVTSVMLRATAEFTTTR